jgi:hypothetical protein
MHGPFLPAVLAWSVVLLVVGAGPPVDIRGTVVDEAGKPVAGAVVRATLIGDPGVARETPATTADEKGEFRFTKSLNTLDRYLTLTAANADGLRLGWLNAGRTDAVTSATTFKVVVKPARETMVSVTDSSGAAVADATVVLLVGTFARAAGSVVCEGRTAADGTVWLRYAADANAGAVLALKSGTGLATWMSMTADGFPADQPEVPQKLTLKLGGAMTVRLQVMDNTGEPVAGVRVGLQQFSRRAPRIREQPPVSFYLGNPGAVPAVSLLTDEHGIATFDWLPADFKGLLQFDMDSETHFTARPLDLISDADPIDREPIKMEVVPFTTISGTVKGEDGKPTAGIRVEAQLDGPPRMLRGHLATALTGTDGTYSLNACPQGRYILQVVDRDWAASPEGLIVRESEPMTGVDFSVAKGTLIRGTVTSGSKRRSVANFVVALSKHGNVFPKDTPKPGDVKRPENRPDRSPSRLAWTDTEGRYQFRAVSGSYTLSVVDNPAARSQKTADLTIDDELEILRDFHVEGSQLETLSGVVVGPDDRPIPGAIIRALYTEPVRPFPNREIRTTGNSAGEFQIERQPVALWLFVSSPDGALASRVQVEAAQNSVTCKLAPAATVVGRLIDDDIPVADVEVVFRQRFTSLLPGRRTPLQFFNVGSATSDANGRFAMPGLIVGETFLVGMNFGADGQIHRDPLLVDRPGVFNLGFIDLPKWRMQVTTDNRAERRVDVPARAAGRFNVKSALAERISIATADARRENRRVLLMVGDPQTQAAQSLFKIIDKIDADAELSQTLADFLPVYIGVGDKEAINHFTETYQVELPQQGSALLVILGADGSVAGRQAFTVTGDPPQLEIRAVHEFLNRHTLRPPDAEQLLKAAVRQAREENKRVLLLQSGSSVYPCRLLLRFIDRHRELLDRDYMIVQIDDGRTPGADAVLKSLRQTGNGVPWVAILNGDGVKLADSESPTGNIGFPSESDDIDYFINKMLKPSVQRLTKTDLEILRSALAEK